MCGGGGQCVMEGCVMCGGVCNVWRGWGVCVVCGGKCVESVCIIILLTVSADKAQFSSSS